jgi:ectoine hydroxylase-related dioxygenase (phytanoyl-CoA dioxygenase family)
MALLDANGQMISNLWLDQADAHDRIEERRSTNRIDDADAEMLHGFVDDGYITLSLGLDADFLDAFERDVERQWRERPVDLAIAPGAGGRRSFRDVGHKLRAYRIADLHSHSDAALALYLHPELFRVVELIFDDKAIAFQSLYFRYGSEQSLHRDPMFVPTTPPSHLLASWIALESISADCGPLLYAPGSHRLPWYEFEPDSVTMGAKHDSKRDLWNAYRDGMIEQYGLEVKSFTCAAGDAFIWHAGLLHGGAARRDDALSRKSFVVHYSTASNYTTRQAGMQMKVMQNNEEVSRRVTQATHRILERNGCSGLDNPMRGVHIT